ncbi:hypothetical protein APHAL10511_000671 [Amanita phalloides]|nr:hypothetical protein APHAL10511_000671 [Amanita phalloides]
MQDALRLPAWLKSGPYPRVHGYAQPLIDEVRASCATLPLDLWDLPKNATDEGESGWRFRASFGTTLGDCASICNVVQVEKLDNVPIPKESFLVVLVRNIFLTLSSQVLSLEEVPISLPRHFSGQPNPLLKFMSKSVIAPLVVTICEKIRSEDTNDSKSDSDREELSLSEFLRRCEQPLTADDVEEEEDDVDEPLPDDFDAHFLSYTSSMKTSPSTSCIPVLCMADDKQLPEIMSSLLYQRRVWHIDEPLIAIGFSKYDTTIRLYLGWLVEPMGPERVLPYVHLGQVETSVVLDLSMPLIALAISNLIIRLGSQISDISAIVHDIAPAVIAEIQSQSSFAWRIDTRVRDGNPISNVQRIREQIMRWAENQNYTPYEDEMPRRTTTKSTPSTSDALFSTPPTSTTASSPVPEIRTSDGHGSQADSNVFQAEGGRSGRNTPLPSFIDQMSCSAFAGKNAIDDYGICCWLFDRKTVPQALAPDHDDPHFKKYTELTEFIWPTIWDMRENLPNVDAGLEACVEQLLKAVNELKLRPNAVKLIEPAEFPADLKLLSYYFSAIFNASQSALAKAGREENVCEISWRHDHDRLLLDFFKRQIRNSDDMTIVDPSVYPVLECTLRFPKSDRMENTFSHEIQYKVDQLVSKLPALAHQEWILRRCGGAHGAINTERNNRIHIAQQHARWSDDVFSENEFQRLLNLGGDPASGKCDALGQVQVELPYVVPKDFALTRVAVKIKSNGEPEGKTRKAEKARQPRTTSETSRSLQVPDKTEPAKPSYSIMSASVSSTVQESVENKTPTDKVISDFDKLQISDDEGTKEMKGFLDLPIIAIEYKKQLVDAKKGTNQLRMYLTACVKYLHVLGITEFMVFGIQTDGTHTALPAAVMTNDGMIHMYERLVDKLDISTPLGAWHLVTILNRLAMQHAKCLQEKFNAKKERLVTLLGKDLDPELSWTIEHQRTKLVETGQVKPRKDKASKKASSKEEVPGPK